MADCGDHRLALHVMGFPVVAANCEEERHSGVHGEEEEEGDSEGGHGRRRRRGGGFERSGGGQR